MKIGVIGGGNWGKNHVKTLISLNAFGGLVDPDQRIRNEIKDLCPNVVLKDKMDAPFVDQMDGIVIATPPTTHLELAKEVIALGKPLLVEKPMVLSVKEGEELNNQIIKFDGKLMVGHLLLFHPAIMKMKSLLKDGLLGDLKYIYSNRLNLGKVRKNENVFWSFAPHDISIFQFMLNEFPSEVSSKGGAFLQNDIHDTSLTYFKYPSGVHAHIFVNWLHPFKEHRLVMIGSKGSLHFEGSMVAKPLKFFKKQNGDSPLDLSQHPAELIEYPNELPLTNELKYFMEYIRGATIEKANLESGIEVIKILEMASDSLNKNATTVSPFTPASPPGAGWGEN